MRAVATVALGSLGLVAVMSSLPVFRRPRLAGRLHGYLGSLGPRRSPLLAPDPRHATALSRALRPLLDDLGARLQRLLGDDGRDLSTRLDAAGSALTASQFRARQVTWGLLGFAGTVGCALLLAVLGRPTSGLGVIAAAVAFGVGAVMFCDRSLSRAVERRRRGVLAEFPTFVDLVCLAVTAGESLRGALEVVAERGAGPLAGETRAVIRDVRSGRPLAEALESRARRLGVPSLDRFVGAVLAAQERGMPLADALRAMAFDVREGEKRAVIEAGGRKQISMLLPVVGLILPVAIVFAFYPGLVAIRTLAG